MSRLVRLALLPFVLLAGAADWPQWRGPARDNVWPVKGLPDRLTPAAPRWRAAVGAGYGGVAVAGGRVVLMDRRTAPREVERVVCLDAATGEELWAHAYPVSYGKLDYGNGPRATPTVHAGLVHTLGALGHLVTLEAASGKVVWAIDTTATFKGRVPTWGHSASPLVEGDLLIVPVGGQPGAGLVALERKTGKEVWRALDDPAGYCSPAVLDAGKARILAFFTPKHITALDPATGKLLWKEPFEGITYGVSISDVVAGRRDEPGRTRPPGLVLLASNYWSGSKALTVDAEGRDPKPAWEGKQLSLLMSTPLVRGGHVYALDRFKGLKCLELATGKVLWEGWHVTPRDTNPHASLVWVGPDRALIFTTPGEVVLAELTPGGHKELGRIKVTGKTWAHPGFGAGCVFGRTDEEVVCVPLGVK